MRIGYPPFERFVTDHLVADLCQVDKSTAARWRRGDTETPYVARKWVESVLLGHQLPQEDAWRGFRFFEGELWTATGYHLTPRQLDQFRLNLETFVDLARNAGAVPVLVTQARLVADGNTEAERGRIGYDYALLSHAALVEAFEATDRAARAVSRAKAVALIDASARLTGRAEFFVDHVHLTDPGSAALASLVADEFDRMLGARLVRAR